MNSHINLVKNTVKTSLSKLSILVKSLDTPVLNLVAKTAEGGISGDLCLLSEYGAVGRVFWVGTVNHSLVDRKQTVHSEVDRSEGQGSSFWVDFGDFSDVRNVGSAN